MYGDIWSILRGALQNGRCYVSLFKGLLSAYMGLLFHC